MAPIIAHASSGDELKVAEVSKETLKRNYIGDDYLQQRLEGSDVRDDNADQPGIEDEPIDGENMANYFGHRQSNLFEEEAPQTNRVIQTSYEINDAPPQLSLMASYSPTSLEDVNFTPTASSSNNTEQSSLSLIKSYTPTSAVGGLEDVNFTPPPMASSSSNNTKKPFDDHFAVGILNQIDADEELARQLQEEENKKQQQQQRLSKPKTRVLPSVVDLLGAPLPSEVKSSYTKVSNRTTSSSTSSDISSVSDGISMVTKSFKKWGNDLSAKCTDFFGEDIALQVRSPSARKSTKNHNTGMRSSQC